MLSAVRKATPDSEVFASSEDDKPWPSAPSFGTLPRKENAVPGIGGGIWSSQRRGSFKMEKATPRTSVREVRLGVTEPARNGFRNGRTPSPAVSDGSSVMPTTVPLQAMPKLGRSLSHSQGQREFTQALPGSNEHHPAALPLGLLAEEGDTESDSELGGELTHTKSQPSLSFLHRTSTYPPTYESFYGEESSSTTADSGTGAQPSHRGDTKLEGAFAKLALDHQHRRAPWQSHLGWDDVPNVNESRRHSLADIPTRHGSFATGSRTTMGGGSFWPPGCPIKDWDYPPLARAEHSEVHLQPIYGRTIVTEDGLHEALRQHSEAMNSQSQGEDFNIPNPYKAPDIQISEHERNNGGQRMQANMPMQQGQWSQNRPRKQLFIVSFKCSRVDCFYLLENTGLDIKEGDIVIVEADRGQDLGTVQHANVSHDEARVYKQKYGEEQYKWLMMFSKNNKLGSVNPNAQDLGESSTSGAARTAMVADATAMMQASARDHIIKPKAIKRLANNREIHMLTEKEANEAKAKRTCQQKVAHLNLDMEILDAEWQWDFQKLIFYYYADRYINFKELITELYRIYKARIWLSAINPASFSQHAMGQPPSGIGPGAIGSYNPYNNSTYTMAYGADPDPYGAVPPYRIGYETYTPNFPQIPGIPNSFSPSDMSMNSGTSMRSGASMGSDMSGLSEWSRIRAGNGGPMAAGTSTSMATQASSTQPSLLGLSPFAHPYGPVSDRAFGPAYNARELLEQCGGAPFNTAPPVPQRSGQSFADLREWDDFTDPRAGWGSGANTNGIARARSNFWPS